MLNYVFRLSRQIIRSNYDAAIWKPFRGTIRPKALFINCVISTRLRENSQKKRECDDCPFLRLPWGGMKIAIFNSNIYYDVSYFHPPSPSAVPEKRFQLLIFAQCCANSCYYSCEMLWMVLRFFHEWNRKSERVTLSRLRTGNAVSRKETKKSMNLPAAREEVNMNRNYD